MHTRRRIRIYTRSSIGFVYFLFFSPSFSFRPFQIPHQHPTHALVQQNPRKDEASSPQTVLGEQKLDDGSEHEGPYTATAHRKTSSERPLGIEVISDDDYGGHVTQGESEAGQDPDEDEELAQGSGEGRDDEPAGRQDPAYDAAVLAAVPVREEAGDGTGQQRDGHERRTDPRSLALPLAIILLQILVDDAEGEGNAVSDEVY